MSTTRSPRRHVRARRRRIYRIRRAVVACACLLLVLGVTLSARGALRTLNALHEQAAAHTGSGIWSSAMSPGSSFASASVIVTSHWPLCPCANTTPARGQPRTSLSARYIWSSAMSPYRAPERNASPSPAEQTPTEDERTRKQREEIAVLEAPLTDAQRNEIYAKHGVSLSMCPSAWPTSWLMTIVRYCARVAPASNQCCTAPR